MSVYWENGKVGVRVFIPSFKDLLYNVLLQVLDCCVLALDSLHQSYT